jgi:hypothetical protein
MSGCLLLTRRDLAGAVGRSWMQAFGLLIERRPFDAWLPLTVTRSPPRLLCVYVTRVGRRKFILPSTKPC